MQRASGGIDNKRHIWHGLVVFVLGVAAYLRFRDLDRTSLWYDEAVSWSQSRGSLADLAAQVAQDNYPPLHNIVLWFVMPVFGDSESVLRLPSALLGVLAVWLIYLLGSRLGGKPAGLLCAALLALSPFHIWYSTEARMYALLATSGLAFLLATLEVLHRPGRVLWVTAAVTGALFLYSHVYALLGFASVGIAVSVLVLTDLRKGGGLWMSRAFSACLAMAVSTLAFFPWLIILASRAQSVAKDGFWIAYPDINFLKNMIFGITGSLFLFWLLVGLAVLKIVSVLRAGKMNEETGWSGRAVFVVAAYTIGPVLLAYLYSVSVQPILFDRYLIAAWPGLVLLAAAGATSLLPAIVPAAVLAAALYLTYPELRFTLDHKVRPEWRQIVADYQEKRSPDDRLILYKGFAAPALTYYLRESNGFTAIDEVNSLAETEAVNSDGSSWLLLVHTSEAEAAAALSHFQSDNEHLAARRFGWGASALSLYEKREQD